MKPLNITMIAPFGIRPKGTLSARMLPLAQALVQRGHRVSIVAPPVQNPEDAGTRAVYGGVPVIHTALPRAPGPLAVLAQSQSLLRAALAEGPDLLHLFKPKGFGGLAALAARRLAPRLPLLVDTDDWEGWGGWNDLLPYPYSAKLLFAWQERDLPRRAAAVTVASRTLESLVWGMGVPSKRVFYLPNGVTDEGRKTEGKDEGRRTKDEGRGESKKDAGLSSFVLRPSSSMLLYTRFWEFDLGELVAALAGVVAQEPQARLIVVGKGERGEEHELLRLCARAGLAGSLDYRGWAQPAEIPDLLASASIGLVPVSDTLINRARCSAKLLELMSAGLALVASDVGQSGAYISHGLNGLLVPPHSPGALAGAAVRLLRDQALRERLGAQARRIGERFSWAALAPLAEQAYAAALAERIIER
jgi:glycosyltransferase involved in cell wall biosynthesis